MKVADAARRSRREKLSPLKARVLQVIDEHPDEVYTYRDPDLIATLGIKSGALSFTLWALEREGRIEKAAVNGQVFFGSPVAIARLRRGGGEEDPWERARELRDRIHARVGNIDTLELLDAVRGPWD